MGQFSKRLLSYIALLCALLLVMMYGNTFVRECVAIITCMFLMIEWGILFLNSRTGDITIFLFGLMYICLGMYEIFRICGNTKLLLYALSISISVDTFSYIGGMIVGGKKLAPSISPNKTVSGFIIGTILGSLIGVGVGMYCMVDFSVIFIVFLTLWLALAAQFGDLVESYVKRVLGVKDSSNIIPGHGGLLDRFDSIILVSISLILIESINPRIFLSML